MVPDSWNDDLVLFIYVTTMIIPKGAQVTMDYGGDMWQPLDKSPRILPSNTRRIECGCANPCPKRMGRLDWIERRNHSVQLSSTSTRWRHSSDGLVLESKVAVVGARRSSANEHVERTGKVIKLSGKTWVISRWSNQSCLKSCFDRADTESMIELTRLGADQITQLGVLAREFSQNLA